MRLANGIVIDKEATFGALKFSALRRERQHSYRADCEGKRTFDAGNERAGNCGKGRICGIQSIDSYV